MKIHLNGETKVCPEGITLEQLFDSLKFDKNRVAAELNLMIVPREEFSSRILKNDDVVEVVTFVGGG